MTGLNSFDITLLILISISALIGLMRGFIREVISLLAWVAAFVVSILFSSRLAGVFTGPASNAVSSVNSAQPISVLAIASCFIGLFITTLIIGLLLSRMISQLAEGQGMSLANRFFGALFGFLRGFLIVVIMLFLAQLTPFALQEGWKQSQFVISFQPALKWLDELVQPGLSSLKSKMGNSLKNVDPSEYIDKIKKSYQNSEASQFFQQK